MLLSLLTLPLLATVAESEEHGHGGNPPAEVLLVFFMLLVVWGAFRVTSKRRS